MEECLAKFWGSAVEQLPYESAEGGYQGQTWETEELLFDEVGLSLPRDDDVSLQKAIREQLSVDVWCDYDWLRLDEDQALRSGWKAFCNTVKHERRFFFHQRGGDPDDIDSYSAESLLKTIASLSESLNLIRPLPKGTRLWRARTDIPKGAAGKMEDFGPPPKQYALQSNRMNPPGIPMMYAASTRITAVKETRATQARVGLWKTLRNLRVLDLRKLPPVPGVFSSADRRETLGISFLRDFAADIVKPVARDERHHVDYLPSQVVSEFLKDYEFAGGPIDGVAYESTIHKQGWNIALFIVESALCDSSGRSISSGSEVEHAVRALMDKYAPANPWLQFVKSVRGKV